MFLWRNKKDILVGKKAPHQELYTAESTGGQHKLHAWAGWAEPSPSTKCAEDFFSRYHSFQFCKCFADFVNSFFFLLLFCFWCCCFRHFLLHSTLCFDFGFKSNWHCFHELVYQCLHGPTQTKLHHLFINQFSQFCDSFRRCLKSHISSQPGVPYKGHWQTA